jgi:hypothetical protein
MVDGRTTEGLQKDRWMDGLSGKRDEKGDLALFVLREYFCILSCYIFAYKMKLTCDSNGTQ